MPSNFPAPSRAWRLGATLAAALTLAACQSGPATHHHGATTAGQALASAPVLRQDLFQGIYEVAVAPSSGAVFVATAPSFDATSPGFVHRLDARTLQPLQTVQLPRRAFALGLNSVTNTLYVGNTLDGSLTVVDATSGQVKGQIQLGVAEKAADGKESMPHTRKVVIDEKHDRVFVTSPGQPGIVWIVDGAKGTLTHTLRSEGIWTAGAAYDAAANRLYVSQGGVHEILAIDPDAGRVVGRFSTGDSTGNTAKESKHFFLNLALDAKGQRLFSTDSNTSQVYVFDIASGKVVKTIALGLGALDVAYNPQRNEIYATHRGVSREKPEGSGALTVIDGASYAVKRRIELPVHPNSLAVTPDGNTLYVSVKAPRGEKHPAFRKDSRESLVRIDLR
ncbi:MAG: YncE family protein [Comamonadaceae bacterium]|nr:MAG: YncE family protein [Comamonadaceae bacterium]